MSPDVKLFDDFERDDPTPMHRLESPTGYVCPECRSPLEADWSGEHSAGCTIATWPLPALRRP